MIAVLGAMRVEIEGLAARLQNCRTVRLGRIECRTGTLGGRQIVAVCCGVGMVAAAAAAAAVVARFRPTLMVNIGVAGGLAGQKPLDLVLPARVVQHDLDTTAVGDPPGYLGDLGCVYLETDAAARKVLRAVLPEAREGTLASGDVFVAGREAGARIAARFGADCCDMEGAAIAHAAALFDTRCCILRAISDAADGGDYALFARQAAAATIDALHRAILGGLC